ncbi:MAG: hypothetical protein ABI611_18255 [Solirubrobacteraceae bacterium]
MRPATTCARPDAAGSNRGWQLRPAFALDRSAPPEARSLGIGPRLLLTWVLCPGVPILMVARIPVGRKVTDPKDLIAPIWFAAGAAMGAGFIATKLATQAVAGPVRARALASRPW